MSRYVSCAAPYVTKFTSQCFHLQPPSCDPGDTLEYWGCAAGQGAFLSFRLWHRVSFMSFRNWDRVLFWASKSGHPLTMYFADFPGNYQPNSVTFFSLIASKCYKQILKSLKRPSNMKYIGINYTISWSIKFGVYFQIGTGCLFSREANWDRVRFWTCRGHTTTHL